MANKTLHLILALALVVMCVSMALATDCPSSTKVLTCTPKCLHDSECSAIGGKCCPNLCNGRSCVQPNLLNNSGGSSAFNKNSGSSAGYCGNTKCSPYEKCETDRSTKRPKCVRT